MRVGNSEKVGYEWNGENWDKKGFSRGAGAGGCGGKREWLGANIDGVGGGEQEFSVRMKKKLYFCKLKQSKNKEG